MKNFIYKWFVGNDGWFGDYLMLRFLCVCFGGRTFLIGAGAGEFNPKGSAPRASCGKMVSQREQNTGFDKKFRKNFKKTDKTAKLFEKKTIFISESFSEGPCLPKTAQKRCIGKKRGSAKHDGRQ